GGAISWRARKQPLVAFSTVEAEYIGASDAAKEAFWIRNLYADIALRKRQALTETAELAKNPRFHERTKHINIRFHFVRDACTRGALRIDYIPTNDMVADIMTKSLPRDTHWKHTALMGIS
ncbi:hypothetical protein BJ508DRAFT_200605, partial [Ascobolus immersus RN42]